MEVASRRGSLLANHDSLDELFSTSVRSARIGDWVTCDESSEMFAIALDVHLRHEEAVQFPRYAEASELAAGEVQQFLTEHGQIRRAVGRLLASFQARALDLESVVEVEFLLRAHDVHESTCFLPWLTLLGRC